MKRHAGNMWDELTCLIAPVLLHDHPRWRRLQQQLAALCRDYPGFHTYAELMEEAAEAERQKPARPYDDLPALPDALKEQLFLAARHCRQTGTRLPARSTARSAAGTSGPTGAKMIAASNMSGGD